MYLRQMKKKIIHRIPIPKSWFMVAGSPSINYCGQQMYEWTYTTTLPNTERLNIVYRIIADDKYRN